MSQEDSSFVGRAFFSKALIRSIEFLTCTLGVVAAVVEVVLIQVRFASSLPVSAVIWLLLAALGLVALWIRAQREHSRISELLRQSEAEHAKGSQLDVVLRSAATMMLYGLAVASVSVIAALIGFSKTLAGLHLTH